MLVISQRLVTRWEPDRILAAVAVLHGRVDVSEVAFGQVGGRWDLRGLSLPQVAKTPLSQSDSMLLYLIEGFADIRQTSWRDLDLSHAELGDLRLTDLRIENCSFVKANLSDLRMWGTQVTNSDFTQADLRNAMVGAWVDGRGDSFIDCRFDRTRLGNLMTDAGEFVRCQFLSIKLKSQRFMSTAFRHCVFTGKLQEVVFDGRDLSESTGRPGHNDMYGCDFTDSQLDDVQFIAIDASNMKLPTGPDYVVISKFPRVISAAKKWLTSAPASHYPVTYRQGIAEIFDDYHPELMSPDAANFLNYRDFRIAGAPALEEIARAAIAIGVQTSA
jgi:uncharacterized protein YjbI with pentapeptide repeats